MLYQLFRPFSYLTIFNVGHKAFYDYIIPLALTIISLFTVCAGNNWEIAKIVSENRLAAGLFDVVKNLPGFYIAALAAIATFNKPELDNIITDQNNNSPQVNVRHVDHNGRVSDCPTAISRRVFLSMLFAYLTAMSFVIIILYVVFYSAGFLGSAYVVFASILNVAFTAMFWQVVVCTFFGLYYLGDKIHH
ncbi:hypothetical protein EOE67_17390 [Rheinheimera riviphila]|uniref:Uncharacterized protein n=1 Tax=Rheinheimera riviphila TaxID=1834037 RepID=A0A437QFC7_9GAMM|nr:hypothetical protein [Rheinheimera riviphila]RVU33233.1 hypothetical protein EOE67_17390 [Rheinheimera riviphila]